MNVNQCNIGGRLVADPELTTTPSGKSVAKLRLAVQRPSKSKTAKPMVDYLSLVFWEKSAEFIAKYGRKGARLFVEGSQVQSRNYEGKNGKVYITEFVGGKMELIDWPDKGERSSAAQSFNGEEEEYSF